MIQTPKDMPTRIRYAMDKLERINGPDTYINMMLPYLDRSILSPNRQKCGCLGVFYNYATTLF